jgi:hypothetical protein
MLYIFSPSLGFPIAAQSPDADIEVPSGGDHFSDPSPNIPKAEPISARSKYPPERFVHSFYVGIPPSSYVSFFSSSARGPTLLNIRA